MNISRTLVFFSLFAPTSLLGCIDVGSRPDPEPAETDVVVVEDVAEVEIDPCEAAENRSYRCRPLPFEEVQICKERADGSYIWDTVDFCSDSEGCLESPLNDYPMCASRYQCFDVVQNLVSCDSAPELQSSASDRNDCRAAVQRLAIDDSYRDLYDCYYAQKCEDASDVFGCVITFCPDVLETCYHHGSVDEGVDRVAEADVMEEPTVPSGPDASGTSEPSLDALTNAGKEEDTQMSESALDTSGEEGGDPVPPGQSSPICVEVWKCVADCGQSCQETCNPGEGPVVDDYSSMICVQECKETCPDACTSGYSYHEELSFTAGMMCISDYCEGIGAEEIQACMWQSCPVVYSHCLKEQCASVSDPEDGACEQTFECMLAATSDDISDVVHCAQSTNAKTFEGASDLLACIGTVTLPDAACPWSSDTTSWAKHVQNDAECIAAECATELLSCPVSSLSY